MTTERPPTIDTRLNGDVLIVDISGRWQTANSGVVAELFAELLEMGHQKLLLNLENLEFLSSAGMRVILRTAKTLRAQGGEVKLCSARGLVTEVLTVSGFNNLLHLCDDEAMAIRAF